MNKTVLKVPEIIKRLKVFILAGTLLATACSDEAYDRHYQADPALVAENNLWTTIEAMPELSRFAGFLKNHGYDQLLSQTQAYTVFAPNNDALAALDTSNMDVLSELIENHIARFIRPASGSAADPVAMLNGKWIDFVKQGDNYYFGSAPFTVPAKSVMASNGIVHLLDAYESFFPNIWEYLAKGAGLDSIKNYLYAFDEIVFVPERSVPGSIVDGQQTYLDSVFVNSNARLSRLGYINREDSSYIMLVPNNQAWTEAYNRIKDYYVYYNKNAQIADSLQRANTAYALVQDLFFSNTLQTSPQDSLISTSSHTFYKPQYLFDGAEPVTTSNGTAYITDQLKLNAWESWHEPIIVEAERTLGRENTVSTPSVQRVTDLSLGISGGRYLKLEPTTSSGNPTVTFDIPNTLSASYNIYCVFVSEKAINPNAQGLKPCQVYFSLSYMDDAGKIVTDRFPASGKINTKPEQIDTIPVVSGFKFPTTNYGEKDANGESVTYVTLKVVSNVDRKETTEYSRVLLLDCILMEPQKQ
ncbi:MAG: fasciclin domain-containing protein [Bacteroidales bacterium]|jgi:uncharacterized surface protein with fasciclin (FAS1) repeats|nr:fasciclin domain-containing protein [Bacteroidales bacterium]